MYINKTTKELKSLPSHEDDIRLEEIPPNDREGFTNYITGYIEEDGVYYATYTERALTQEEENNVKKQFTPQQITPRQCRLQLLALGLLDEVETMCNANREMQIWFEYSLDFQRSHPMIEAMGVQLGLTQDDLDTMFIEANKL